jgi:hypothetical protein
LPQVEFILENYYKSQASVWIHSEHPHEHPTLINKY